MGKLHRKDSANKMCMAGASVEVGRYDCCKQPDAVKDICKDGAFGTSCSKPVLVSAALQYLQTQVCICLTEFEFILSCRPTEFPFWFGLVLPFVFIYFFNWAIFVLIMWSLARGRLQWLSFKRSFCEGHENTFHFLFL